MKNKTFLKKALITIAGTLLIYLFQEYTWEIFLGRPDLYLANAINWFVVLIIFIIGITFGPVTAALCGFFGIFIYHSPHYFKIRNIDVNLILYLISWPLAYGLYGLLNGMIHKKFALNVKGIMFSLLGQITTFFLLVFILGIIRHFDPYFFGRFTWVGLKYFFGAINALGIKILFVFISETIYIVVFTKYIKKNTHTTLAKQPAL